MAEPAPHPHPTPPRLSRNRREGSGIVYCLSRDDTETVAAQIREHTDITAAHYHAGLRPCRPFCSQRRGSVRGWWWQLM